MLRFAVLALCLTSIWASPSPLKGHTKVAPFKLPGPRIINGEAAKDGQFPWQVGLEASSEYMSWFCGGSIISEEWILTAGHCVEDATSGSVISGSISIDSGERNDIAKFILHEDYDTFSLANDIGLVQLAKPLTLGPNVGIVNLASEELAADTAITVSGWGITSDAGTSISSVLNYVNLVTITNTKCDESYGDGSILDDMICATSDSSTVKSTCSGDSGGPVVINADSDPVHVAVVSFVHVDGCESGAPSGYTRTAYYRDWIKKNSGV